MVSVVGLSEALVGTADMPMVGMNVVAAMVGHNVGPGLLGAGVNELDGIGVFPPGNTMRLVQYNPLNSPPDCK